jgi:hypothetical protein
VRAQLGRPWDKVFSEICAGIDRRNTVLRRLYAVSKRQISTREIKAHQLR